MSENLPSTKPYLIRAIHEWCCDNGFTPYAAVRVDEHVRVPREYARDAQIVLNIAYEATVGLRIANDWIAFKARFGGVAHDISFPIVNVMAIYARENGVGMAFEPENARTESPGEDPGPRTPPPAGRPKLQRIK
jgi:stringent starvation protein B